MPIPKKMAEAPELKIGLGLFYTAWRELSSCRVTGLGEGPIPWTAISEWCKANEIDGDLKSDVFYHVRGLDNEYLKWQQAKAKKERGGK